MRMCGIVSVVQTNRIESIEDKMSRASREKERERSTGIYCQGFTVITQWEPLLILVHFQSILSLFLMIQCNIPFPYPLFENNKKNKFI